MWRRLAMAILLPVAALLLAPPGAQATTQAELCSDPAAFGSYALRACIENVGGFAHPYVYVSLKAGHSPCEVRLRWVRSDGVAEPGDAPSAPCPAGVP